MKVYASNLSCWAAKPTPRFWSTERMGAHEARKQATAATEIQDPVLRISLGVPLESKQGPSSLEAQEFWEFNRE